MPEALPPTAYPPWRISESQTKADSLANYCFYMIAMGKWRPGSRLPAVRHLEKEWVVNRLTVLKAYRALAERGLVHHKPNGSYYVAEQGPKRDFARDRIEIENIYREVSESIERGTDLAPLGVLRIFTRMAEAELREQPDAAFVECSKSQAAGHAREITDRLGFPVLPLVLDDLRGKRMRIPSQVRNILTTTFHADELASLEAGGKTVASLPIEISPGLLAEIETGGRDIIFLETDRHLAQRTAKDAVWMMSIEKPRVEVVSDVAGFLVANLSSRSTTTTSPLYLVPQKEWEVLDAQWRGHASVRPIVCTLSASAWEIICDTLGIPFGLTV